MLIKAVVESIFDRQTHLQSLCCAWEPLEKVFFTRLTGHLCFASGTETTALTSNSIHTQTCSTQCSIQRWKFQSHRTHQLWVLAWKVWFLKNSKKWLSKCLTLWPFFLSQRITFERHLSRQTYVVWCGLSPHMTFERLWLGFLVVRGDFCSTSHQSLCQGSELRAYVKVSRVTFKSLFYYSSCAYVSSIWCLKTGLVDTGFVGWKWLTRRSCEKKKKITFLKGVFLGPHRSTLFKK